MSTEVAVQNTGVAVFKGAEGFFDGVDETDMRDQVIWICQGLSKAVTEGDRKPGDIIFGGDSELVDADAAQGPITVIPVSVKKHIELFTIGSGSDTMDRSIPPNHPDFVKYNSLPVGPNNAFLQDGVDKYVRKCAKIHVLLAKDLKDGAGIPVIINFRNTSYDVARTIMTKIRDIGKLGHAPWALAYTLGIVKNTNDKGTWWAWDLTGKREVTKEENDIAKNCFLQLQMATQLATPPAVKGETPIEEEVPF